ncbi:multidrug efflux SMR transporter [Chitiniphilus purpureus]|uniref:Multidrug efflux SMR transporter n=1 Tax=Chitiniphilus purpureus TaxID=2981137 RepID=A0ABY6DP67_9NEIS|nr:multidrug efflux SMR transporter [Chitiniphilus sp. CD1]UXY15473.1 multidrug efflux SMR transporter [Chitiniphilus sp. CD1]
MHWLYLTLAIVFEVAGTTCMKLSDGFSKLGPSVLIFVFYGLCAAFITLALKHMEIAIAYAIWAGLGTALIAGVGMLYFKEPVTAVKIGSLVLIVLGIAGLNLSGVSR